MRLHHRVSSPPRSILLVLLSGSLLLRLWLAVSQAQVTTALTPDGTLGTAVTRNGNLYTITGGTRPGNGLNLFHSFDRFSVGTGDIASFNGQQTGITNILSRVTGGQRSDIYGQLRTDGQLRSEGANLYLLNPAGVLFGPSASLDVTGSFHVSTADYLRLADGERFAARLSDTSTLSIAPPEAFGFLGPTPAPITIQGSALMMRPEQTLSLIGGDLTLVGGQLTAPSGRLHLASVAEAGEVGVSIAAWDAGLTMTPGRRLGHLELTQRSTLDTGGDGGGTIIIRSGTLLVDQSLMSADTLGMRPGAATGLDVQVTEAAVLTRGSSLTTNVGGTGRAGDIRITTGSLELREGAVMGSSTSENTTGDSGHITITTGRLQLTGRGGTRSDPISPISTETRGAGKAGDIVVQAREVVLSEGAQISGTTFGPGRGGSVSVKATETLTLRGTTPEGSSGLFARTAGSGDAGTVEVQARGIMLSEGATISSSTLGPGQGGTVTVRATETLTMRGASIVFANAGIRSRLDALTGAAGTVQVQARDIILSDGAQIASATSGPGAGGRVTVTATETLTLRGTTPDGNFSTGVLGSTQGSKAGAGAAGTVQVQARDIILSDGAQIASATSGPGQGGTVTVMATETLTLQGTGPGGIARSGIVAGVGRNATGAGGTVEVQARDVLISEGGGISSSTGGPGRGGTVTVTAINTLTLQGTTPDGANPSGIFARARGLTERAGAAGTVQVQARDVVLSDGAQISSSTLGPGQGGTVTVYATNALTLTGQQSGLRTTAEGSGQGGDIVLQTRAVHLTEGAAISAQSSGTGNAGTLRLQVQEQFRSANSIITTEAAQSGGGDITIEAGMVSLTKDSRITAAAMGAPGVGSNGGNVTIQAEAIALNHSQVKANAFGGQGGHIGIKSGVLLTDAGTCPAMSCLDASSGVGLPGTVEVHAPETEVRGAVAPLPHTFASAATLLRDRCAARLHEGTASSLVERGRDGVPASPDGLLPSRLSGTQPAAATPRAGQRPHKTPVAQVGGLQRDANGQLQIKNWPASAASAQVQEVECAAR